MEVRRFLSIVWGKFTLSVFLLAVTALSARAVPVPVTEVNGVNFQYTASDVNGSLTVTFTDPFNFITQINGSLISPQQTANFAQLTLSPTILTDDVPGLSGHFTPSGNTEQWGFPTLGSAPNVVFNYGITSGSAVADGLTLTGSISLAPGSATTFTQGSTTYDFSAFDNPGTSFTLSLGTQDQTGLLIYNTLKSGNGTFTGSGQFSQTATTDATVPDTGATALLLGFSLAALAFLRRKLAC